MPRCVMLIMLVLAHLSPLAAARGTASFFAACEQACCTFETACACHNACPCCNDGGGQLPERPAPQPPRPARSLFGDVVFGVTPTLTYPPCTERGAPVSRPAIDPARRVSVPNEVALDRVCVRLT